MLLNVYDASAALRAADGDLEEAVARVKRHKTNNCKSSSPSDNNGGGGGGGSSSSSSSNSIERKETEKQKKQNEKKYTYVDISKYIFYTQGIFGSHII